MFASQAQECTKTTTGAWSEGLLFIVDCGSGGNTRAKALFNVRGPRCGGCISINSVLDLILFDGIESLLEVCVGDVFVGPVRDYC